MNGLALLGLLLLLYAVVVIFLAVKKPESVWETGKVQFFIKVFGDKGTVILFYCFALAALGVGILLLVV